MEVTKASSTKGKVRLAPGNRKRFWISISIASLCFLAVSILPLINARAEKSTQAWAKYYQTTANRPATATAIAVYTNGNVFVTGEAESTGIDYLEHSATIAYSPSGTALWTNRYQGPEGFHYHSTGMALDTNGNVFITGSSIGPVSGPMASSFVTIKYSKTGTPIWTNTYQEQEFIHVFPKSIAVDGAGRVFVTGSWYDGLITACATIAYANDGATLWTNCHDGSPITCAVDGNDHLIVTGSIDDDGGFPDFFTVAYSATGIPLWTNQYGTILQTDLPQGMVVDTNGNVFVTGLSDGLFTIAYSNSGVLLWSNRLHRADGGLPAHESGGIAIDYKGNVFVTGLAGHDYFDENITIAYSNSGQPLWTNFFINPGVPMGIAVDSAGNVFTTGYILNDEINSYTDIITLAYSNSGLLLWTNQFNGTWNQSDKPSARQSIAAADVGSVVIAGIQSSGDELQSAFVTIKYTTTFSPVITVHPITRTNTLGTPATLSVTATGSPTLKYQWLRNGTNLANGGNISGATTNSLNIGHVALTNVGCYSVVVTNTAGRATSGVAILTIPANVTPMSLAANPSGNLLEFNWPQDHTGWRLLVQTNAANAGIAPNWTTIYGSQVTNRVLVLPNAAAAFYRLVYP